MAPGGAWRFSSSRDSLMKSPWSMSPIISLLAPTAVERCCGPDMSSDELKQAIRDSLARTGEDDPTGQSLKWNKKHRKAG